MQAFDDLVKSTEAIESLLRSKDLRSADRANLRTMLKKLKRGNPLDYQERYNLWAYISRYTQSAG
ncbi:MAG TPA: hypothetical protein VF221_06430 [Chloroflexota bacterium]